MEVERGQLINDKTARIVALAVDFHNKTIQNKRIERADDLFLLWVIGNNKIAWMLAV